MTVANPHLADVIERHREIAAREPVQFSLIAQDPDPPPKRDLVAEVLAYFNAEVESLRKWAGLTFAQPATAMEYKTLIHARLAEVDGSDDDKVRAAKRVIDVQIHQARSAGKCESTPSDRKRLKSNNGWKYLKITTLFRNQANFGKWLERWSEDGDHELWGQPRHRDANYGADARHGVEDENLAIRTARRLEAQRKSDEAIADPNLNVNF